MPHTTVNGVRIYYEQTENAGLPVVMVHGSWGDHHGWDMVVPGLAGRYRVLTYDRRGHSQSERPAGQGFVREDVDDLAALIEAFDLAPAHVIGNSLGSLISLRLAGKRPDMVRSLVVHEPPETSLIAGDERFTDAMNYFNNHIGVVRQHLEAGENEAGTFHFFESIVVGPGGWERIPPAARETYVNNAPTFLDELRDPDQLWIDIDALAHFDKPALLTKGTTSAPFFVPIVDTLAAVIPGAEVHVYEDAGHVPHFTHAEEYVETVTGFLDRVESQSGS